MTKQKIKFRSSHRASLRPVKQVTPERKIKDGEVVVEPNQAMTIKEILSRFTRGLAPNVAQFKGVYMDHNNTDYEKVSRMDFGEQYEFAQNEAKKAQRIEQALRSREEARKKPKADDDAPEPKEKPKKSGPKRTGIDKPLDNTMPVDTDADDQ